MLKKYLMLVACVAGLGTAANAARPIKITTSSLPSGRVGTSYSTKLYASGGRTPYTWSIVDGYLPTGLSLSSTGTISGTPQVSGSFSVKVQVKDSSQSSTQAAMTSYTLSVTQASATTILWKADHEGGNTSEWSSNSGGGEYDSGIGDTYATTARAHSGNWGAKMTISTPHSPTSGTRMFRWRESRSHRGAYYSVWLYFPTYYSITGNYLMPMQFKSRTSDNRRNDPVWAFYLTPASGKYYLKAGFGWGGTQLAGPYSGNGVGGKFYSQTKLAFPVGRWVHLEAYLYESNTYTGRVILYQDGIKLFDFQNVITSYKNCNYNSWCASNEWSVNLYSDGLSPNPAYIYMDDAKIGTGYIN